MGTLYYAVAGEKAVALNKSGLEHLSGIQWASEDAIYAALHTKHEESRYRSPWDAEWEMWARRVANILWTTLGPEFKVVSEHASAVPYMNTEIVASLFADDDQVGTILGEHLDTSCVDW